MCWNLLGLSGEPLGAPRWHQDAPFWHQDGAKMRPRVSPRPRQSVPGVPQTTPRLPHRLPEAPQRPPEPKTQKNQYAPRGGNRFLVKVRLELGAPYIRRCQCSSKNSFKQTEKNMPKVSKSQVPITVQFRTRKNRALCGKWHSGERSCARPSP